MASYIYVLSLSRNQQLTEVHMLLHYVKKQKKSAHGIRTTVKKGMGLSMIDCRTIPFNKVMRTECHSHCNHRIHTHSAINPRTPTHTAIVHTRTHAEIWLNHQISPAIPLHPKSVRAF